MNIKLSALTLALVCIAIGFIVVGINTQFDGTPQSPEKLADVEGVWHQTDSRGYFNGIKKSEVFEENDLKIIDFDGEYLSCTQRGVDFLAFRISDTIFWHYTCETGYFYAHVNCYGNCLVVNEMFVGNGSTPQIYVSSNLYTKDGKTPDWFDYWTTYINDDKWSIYSAKYTDMEIVGDLPGRNLYVLQNYGPVFMAEMEEYEDGEVVTVAMTGVLTYNQNGQFRAIAIDNNLLNWSLCYNGSVLTAYTLTTEQKDLGDIIAAERNYMHSADSSLPKIPKSLVEPGDQWSLESATVFTGNEIILTEKSGIFTATVSTGQIFGTTGTSSDHITISMLAYTIPLNEDNETYQLSCVFTADYGKSWESGKGYFNFNDNTLSFYVVMDSMGEDMYIVKYTLKHVPQVSVEE